MYQLQIRAGIKPRSVQFRISNRFVLEKKMTPQIPSDLLAAKEAAKRMWQKRRDFIIEAERAGFWQKDYSLLIEMTTAALILDQRASDLYDRWQELGGCSNIESITLAKYSTEKARKEQCCV